MIKAARGLFYCISFMLTATGLAYVFNPQLMSYHYHYLGITPDQLDKRLFFIFQIVKQIIGGLMLAIGVTSGIITYNLYRAPEILLRVLASLLFISLTVSLFAVIRIGETYPVLLVSLSLAFLAAGFFMIWLDRDKLCSSGKS